MFIDVNVVGQKISIAIDSDIVADSVGQLGIRFSFSGEWVDVIKTAIIVNKGRSFYVVIDDDNCILPDNMPVLRTGRTSISVFAGNLITAGSVNFNVLPSGISSSDLPRSSNDVYIQIVEIAQGAYDIATSAIGTTEESKKSAEESKKSAEESKKSAEESKKSAEESRTSADFIEENANKINIIVSHTEDDNMHVGKNERDAWNVKGMACDKIIRTQLEFDTLVSSPTWLDAISVCFVGDGGTFKFVKSDGNGLKVPKTVKQICGVNVASIDITNFKYVDITNHAGLFYAVLPTASDSFIYGINLKCSGANKAIGFSNCTQITNCTGEAITNADGYAPGTGFLDCTKIVNCIGKGQKHGTGFLRCTKIANCIGIAYGSGRGFDYCTQITNSDGIGNGGYGGTGSGFSNCTQITNCTATGTTSSASAGYGGFGFHNCSYINGCKAGDGVAQPPVFTFLAGSNTKVDSSTVSAK